MASPEQNINNEANNQSTKANHINCQHDEFVSNLSPTVDKLLRRQETHHLYHQPNPIVVDQLTTKWLTLCNLMAYNDRNADILEVENTSIYAFAQSSFVSDPTDSNFKVKLLNFDGFKYMAVGLTSIGHQTDKIPGLYEQSIGFDSSGDLMFDNETKRVGIQWKVGDVIECGIIFPENFTKNANERQKVKVYFRRNEQLIVETKVMIASNGYYPTVYVFEGVTGSWWDNGEMGHMSGTATKFKYFK